MPGEIRILLYGVFSLSLFLFPLPQVYILFGISLGLLMVRLPLRTVLAGWLPISVFVLYTFFGNLFGSHGRILMTAGQLVVTDEGLRTALLRSSRLLLMIMGVKVMMGTSRTEDIVRSIGRLLFPLERAGIPVSEFVHTMVLTLECFPALKNMASEAYRREAWESDSGGFRGRARAVSLFLMPLFVRSMRSPESFFRKEGVNEEGA